MGKQIQHLQNQFTDPVWTVIMAPVLLCKILYDILGGYKTLTEYYSILVLLQELTFLATQCTLYQSKRKALILKKCSIAKNTEVLCPCITGGV